MDLPRSRPRFAPSFAGTALAVLGVGLCVALGAWQLDRAAQQRALAGAFESGGGAPVSWDGAAPTVARYQRVRLAGAYDSARQFLLDNMSHAGVAGVQVLTPLRLAGGRLVLVNRGFVPLAGDRTRLPDVAVGTHPREVTGRVDVLPRPAIELATAPGAAWPRLVSFPTAAELGALLDVELPGQVVLLDATEPDGYVRDWRAPGMPPDRHLGYAVQWFALAAAVLVTWLVVSRTRTRERP